jgi:MFS family permease
MLAKFFPNVYEGWVVIFSQAMITTLVGGAFFYGFGAVFNPIVDEFGWSIAFVSFAFSLRSEAGGLVAPIIGIMIDNIGARIVILGGIIFVIIGVLLLSYMETQVEFIVSILFIALGISAASGPVGTVAATTWFERRRAKALAFLSVGGAGAGMMALPVAWLVDEVGWRLALRITALIVLSIGLFLGPSIKLRPFNHHQPLDGIKDKNTDTSIDISNLGIKARQAIFTQGFIFLSLGFILLGFGWTALIIHQIPFLESLGADKTLAGGVVVLFSIFSIIGRLAGGYFGDKYEKTKVLSLAMLVMAVGIFALGLCNTLMQAIIVTCLVAPGFGATAPLRPAILADFFGIKSLGTIAGLSRLFVTIGSFGGPVVVGYAVDLTGSYQIGWFVVSIPVLFAVPVMLLARKPATS